MLPGSIDFTIAGSGYTIKNSLRFLGSGHLYRTFASGASPGPRLWTWSAWIKRGTLGTIQTLFCGVGSISGEDYIRFTAADKLEIYFNNTKTLETTAVFRDIAGWYHIVVAVDTAQATSTNRIKIWINNTQITTFDTLNQPAQNTGGYINTNNIHSIGALRNNKGSASNYFIGYMADVIFVDGIAETPSNFATTDTITGAWVPTRYNRTLTANRFLLQFQDASSTTTIGYDTSGSSNHWTSTGISISAGYQFAQMTDTPSNNFCVLDPLSISGASYRTVANGNLDLQTDVLLGGVTAATFGVSSGKWYWEVLAENTAFYAMIGITNDLNYVYTNGVLGFSSGSYAYRGSDGSKVNNGTAFVYGTPYTDGAIIGVALDMDNGTLSFYLNNTSQGVAYSGLSGTFFPAISDYASLYSSIFRVNFGQRPFNYTPPSGFKSLCTNNLSDPIFRKPSNYMTVLTHTGTGALGSGTTQNITGADFQPDLAWIKCRNDNDSHIVVDSSRGVNKWLRTDQTNTESTTASSSVSAFLSNGITVNGTASPAGSTNITSKTYVDWLWKEDVTAGFDIVLFNGTNAAQTLSHALNTVPSMMIVKNRTGLARQWSVYHKNITNSQNGGIYLNLTNAWNADSTLFNSTAPTSTQFTVGTYYSVTGETYVAYLWSEVAGFSRFGSYTGNGSTDGPFVWCGFRPKFVLIKNIDATTNWEIMDTTRDKLNPALAELYPNAISSENASVSDEIDFLSNGFKLRSTNAIHNANINKFIFAAFAETPFKYARAR